MKTYTSGLENAVPHVVYDLSIPLPERREQAMIFRTSKDVALFLGINYNQVSYYRQIGKRVTGKDGKEYAIRIAKKELQNVKE